MKTSFKIIKKALVIQGLFLFIFGVKAQDPEVHVNAVDPNVDLRNLDVRGVTKNQKIPSNDASANLPSPKVLDELIKEAGLDKEMGKLDQLDKDLIFKCLQYESTESCHEKNKNIPLEKLTKLRAAIEAKGKKDV